MLFFCISAIQTIQSLLSIECKGVETIAYFQQRGQTARLVADLES